MKKNKELDIDLIKRKIVPILKKYNIKRAGIFGSYVRGKQSGDSDIDIVVQIQDELSLIDFIKIKLELQEKLGKKIDLVEYNTIKPLLREEILNSEVVIL